MPLFKRFSLIDRKLSPEKWLKEIEHTSRGLLPVPTNDDGTLFPWAQLRSYTDAYLSKRSLSELERDEALRTLIESAHDQVVGLAACSPHLSAKALLELLESFQHSPGNTVLFLQAFVAASHANTEIFSPQDEAWATVLVRVNSSATHQNGAPSVPAIRLLLNKWCAPPLPTYTYLRNTARDMTVDLLQKMNDTLEGCLLRRDWNQAIQLSTCLADISNRPNGLPQELQDILDWEFSQWRQWVAWKPSRYRLLLWKDHNGSPLMQPFWTALGPDLEPGNPSFETALARLTTRGQLVEWMQVAGLRPGFDLICCDSIELVPFAGRLLSVIDLSCTLGGVDRDLLQYIASSQEGLSQYSLQLWEDAATSIIPRSSGLLAALLDVENLPKDVVEDDTFDWLENGLTDLSAAGLTNLREFLQTQVEQLIKQMAVTIKIGFETAVNTNSSWLVTAEKVGTFRSILSKVDPIYNFPDMGLNIKEQAAYTTQSLEALQELHTHLCEKRTDWSLHSTVRAYIAHVVLGTEHDTDDRMSLVERLHIMWQSDSLMTTRPAALSLVALEDITPAHRRDLVEGIVGLPPKHEYKLEGCFMEYPPVDCIRLCYRIVRIAASVLGTYPTTAPAWRAVVRHVMSSFATLPPDDGAFTHISFKKYRNWIKNYYAVFGDDIPGLDAKRQWVDKLADYGESIDNIRAIEGSTKAVHCIYTASEEPHSTHVFQMLAAIKKANDPDRGALMIHCVLSLADNEKHSQSVSQAVLLLLRIPNEGFQQCKKLAMLAAQESVYIAAVQKDVWLSLSSSADTKMALNFVANALRLPSNTKPETAKDYFMRRIADVVKEAKAVEDMRVKLSRSNRKAVSVVLTTLMIQEQSTAVEEEILDLPSDLMSNIEQVDDRMVELSFPLSYMSYTQRRAWGLASDESVVVRLSIGENGTRTAFCAHVVDPQADMAALKHAPVAYGNTTNPPNTLRCEGRITRLTYMIMRSLWKWLLRDDGMPLADIYRNLDSLIRTSRNNCVVCNQSHPTPVRTYRPSVCVKPSCRTAWLQSALELRLVDLRMDEGVIEMLLAAIHAAANTMSNSKTTLELLPNRPTRLSDAKQLLTLLDKIPKLSTSFNTLDSLYAIRTKHSIRTELLFSWATNNHRAFLMSAPPALQIPNMPGASQFVVVDNPPEIIAAFAQHDALQPRQVLFHGTTIDRLYAILCQGLKILSKTAFQSHGAAYGEGIYLAENPSTALSYSNTCPCSSAVWSANHSTFVNHKVLLGIEYAGNDASRGNGIHVATDPTKLLLRYVFLLPPGFKAPVVGHVVPAIQSNIATLKSGLRS